MIGRNRNRRRCAEEITFNGYTLVDPTASGIKLGVGDDRSFFNVQAHGRNSPPCWKSIVKSKRLMHLVMAGKLKCFRREQLAAFTGHRRPPDIRWGRLVNIEDLKIVTLGYSA